MCRLFEARPHLCPVDHHALVLVERREDRSQLSGTELHAEVLQQLRAERRGVHFHLRGCTVETKQKCTVSQREVDHEGKGY